MSNIHSFPINASAPSNTLVLTSSATVVDANINRLGLVLTNISSSTIYLGLQGNGAILNAGIVLTPNGGVWSMDEFNFSNEAITGITHTSGAILAIQEFKR